MPYVARRRVARRRPAARRAFRGRYARRLARPRVMYNRTPTFTETLDAGALLSSNTGIAGIFSTKISDVPQWQNQSALYTQQCIRKLKVIIVPSFSGSDFPSNLDPATGGAGNQFSSQPRLTFAIQDSPEQTLPGSELDVLAMNGAKIKVVLGRPFSLACRPKPNIGVANMTTGGQIGVELKNRDQWFNFPDSPDPADPGSLPHFGIAWWSQYAQTVLSNAIVAKVQYKVTFSLRDPK